MPDDMDQGEDRVRVTCTRKLGWDSAHRVLRHESKCSTMHGHRYTAEVTCYAHELDSVGRVIDFGVIKEVIGSWVDEKWDHTTLLHHEDPLLNVLGQEAVRDGKRSPYVFPTEPTAENIAKELLRLGNIMLREKGSPVRVCHVRVYETPNCYADASVDPTWRPPEHSED